MRLGLTLVACALAAAAPAHAGDLASASFRLRGIHPASIGPARLTSQAPTPMIGGAGISLGQADALGPSGSASSLRTVYPGFWVLRAGALPSLDIDHDARPGFLDPDDDGDGLLDEVETGTGVYVSPGNTGTSSANPDSDGDGFSDGVEVAAGTDPNSAASHPPSIPALPALARAALALALIGISGIALSRRIHHVD